MGPLCDDLTAETDDLVALLRTLDDRGWLAPTPAPSWTVRHQIAHLAYFDGAAVLAATDPDRFSRAASEVAASVTDVAMDAAGDRDGPAVLAWFEHERTRMTEIFRGLDPKARIVWYGPAMAARSFVTARLMETWAHGQDVADTFGVSRAPTARLRHVAHIGIGARPFSYITNKRAVPDGLIKVVLEPPDGGEPWVWNSDAGDENVVTGPALDFCLVVTQRRHVSDTDLTVRGPLALDWIPIAQAFAGGPGTGRAPGQFRAKTD